MVYRLIDAEQYRGRHVLVVGGDAAALEAAITIADEPGSTVTLSYRSEAFGRVKEKNRQHLTEAAGRLNVLLKSNVKHIDAQTLAIDHEGTIAELQNDAVIVCAGGIPPTPFLKEVGILVKTKYGTA